MSGRVVDNEFDFDNPSNVGGKFSRCSEYNHDTDFNRRDRRIRDQERSYDAEHSIELGETIRRSSDGRIRDHERSYDAERSRERGETSRRIEYERDEDFRHHALRSREAETESGATIRNATKSEVR